MIAAQLLVTLLLANLGTAAEWGKPWKDLIPEGLHILFPIIFFVVELLVLTVVLYLAGLIVVGRKRARFRDAFLIAFLGTVLSTLYVMFIPYTLLPLALSILTWLLLIKGLYETGWLGAIAVGLLAMIIFVVIAVILALIFGIIDAIWKSLLPSFVLFFGSG